MNPNQEVSKCIGLRQSNPQRSTKPCRHFGLKGFVHRSTVHDRSKGEHSLACFEKEYTSLTDRKPHSERQIWDRGSSLGCYTLSKITASPKLYIIDALFYSCLYQFPPRKYKREWMESRGKSCNVRPSAPPWIVLSRDQTFWNSKKGDDVHVVYTPTPPFVCL